MDFESLTNKAKDFLSEHPEALDKVGDLAKEKFQGHDEQIDQLMDKAKEYTSGGEKGGEKGESEQG